ncbi:fibronectin type III domain-containing protein [Chryseobacterium sp. MYb264]|uniref:fibronectin type III domain-containing protein n=1 Tax=Chryseobacterium sp. MYb264 TaxID=2745153 RepID=UPI002E1277E4|nr:fibronectin type III domain-containing protein [Chryseobacterium sp. MYb264]
MKKLSTILVLLLCLIDIGFVPNAYGQASTLPYSQDFSTANDFTFVNGTQTNVWYYGTIAGNPGGSLYITNNGGTSNAYTTNNTTVSHAYKDFTIPAGSALATLMFDWRAYGEGGYDYLRVWLVPSTYTPTPGTEITEDAGRIQVGGDFGEISDWETYSNFALDISTFAGGTVRLVYEWTNDSSFGTQPAAAVDNITLLIPTCLQPSAPAVSAIGSNTATIEWTAPATVPGNGYEYYLSTVNTAPDVNTAGTAAPTTSAILPSLATSTTYYWWVRSVCSTTDKSIWISGGNFSTTQVPAPLPYLQDFTTTNDFEFVNGTSVNKWNYGTATGNTGGSIYISTNNGTTNTYSTTDASTVHAYRDITIPAGATTAVFSYDWKGQGESIYDYLRVWLVPTTYTPTPGTLITAGGGRIQVGADYINLKGDWQHYMNPILNISNFANSTMRLVFQWRNDSGGGTQPPIAVDNVNLYIPTCNVPTALTVNSQTQDGASLSWTGPNPAPAIGYEYYLSTTNTAPTGTTAGTPNTGTTANPSGLASNTTYYWWVRAVCSGTDQSIWMAGPSFTTGQIGTGTTTSSYLPVYSYYGYNYSQQIYTKAELTAAVGNNNSITGIKFFVAASQNPQSNYNQWVVYLGNTAQNNFSSTTNWVPLSGLTQVYSGTLPNMTSGTWVEIPFSAPFIWDGNSNIVVAVDENSPNYTSGATWGSYTAGSNRGILYYNDNTNPDPASPPTASSRYSDIPRIQFKGEPLLPCSINPPGNIALGTVTYSTAIISWTPTLGATYNIQYRVQGTGPWIPAGPVVSPGYSITITGLEEQTTYEVQISTTCGGSTGGYSTSTVFTTTPLSYCPMTGTGTNDHIANVTVTSANVGFLPMSNTTVQNNYTNYNTPATLINLDIGSTGNQVSVGKGWTGTTQSDAVSVWIDFNRNGTFEASERILNAAASTTTPVAAYFDVPANAYPGPLTTTMRVVLKRSSAPTMCEASVTNGEVEDYAVRLRPCSTVVPTAPTFTAPTHTSTTVNWTAVANVTYQVRYRKQGPPAGAWETAYASTQLANIPLTITGLDPATIYDVEIATVCGSNVGTYSPTTSFTTRCDPTPPSITISNITAYSATVSWAPVVPNATYIMRYRIVGSGAAGWSADIALPTTSNTYALTSLTPYTSYEVQIANQCVGETTPNAWSNPKVFITERICELPPPGLTITNITPTTAVVTWDSFPGATYILRYRKVGIPSWTSIPSNTNTITITGLIELTKYEMQVVNVCNGTPGTYTPPYYFTTPTVVYCQMESANGTANYISNVTVKPNGKPEMINESTGSTYTDYTGDSTKFIELIQGSEGNEISISKKLSGTNSDAGIAVWIDFDRSGTFDINERVFAAGLDQTEKLTGTFNVPADAFVSLTDYKYVVMRVAMQKGGIPVNCTSFADGEVEDYTIRITKNPVPNPTNQTDIMIYPNPVSTILNVRNISARANYKLYNAAGQMISSGVILNNKIDVSKLINGVYVIDIEDVKGTAQKKFIKE